MIDIGPVEERFARLLSYVLAKRVVPIHGMDGLYLIHEVMPDGRVRVERYPLAPGVSGSFIIEPGGLK